MIQTVSVHVPVPPGQGRCHDRDSDLALALWNDTASPVAAKAGAPTPAVADAADRGEVGERTISI